MPHKAILAIRGVNQEDEYARWYATPQMVRVL